MRHRLPSSRAAAFAVSRDALRESPASRRFPPLPLLGIGIYFAGSSLMHTGFSKN